jgi:hypothetical protein
VKICSIGYQKATGGVIKNFSNVAIDWTVHHPMQLAVEAFNEKIKMKNIVYSIKTIKSMLNSTFSKLKCFN